MKNVSGKWKPHVPRVRIGRGKKGGFIPVTVGWRGQERKEEVSVGEYRGSGRTKTVANNSQSRFWLMVGETGSRNLVFPSRYLKRPYQTPLLPFICRVRIPCTIRGLSTVETKALT